jgi:cation diffusion facilitator CzcD-associated flavoprotein CzcO
MREHAVVVVGAGFAGLGMAIRLKQAGFGDFVVLEQANDVGGTWLHNRYPGCACDVQSHLYSFSFEPWPRWTRDFAPQGEILEYLRHCADKYGLLPHLRFGARVVRATWDQAEAVWHVETSDGQGLRARVLVSGCGFLSRLQLPDIRGLASFEGKTFHSAAWDESLRLDGKVVSIIGTGASAIQIVPALAPRVRQLFVYQRTAPWLMPKPDAPIPRWKRALYARAPAVQKLARQRIYWTRELIALGFVVAPRLLKIGERLSRRFIDRSIEDPALRRKLVPSYAMGCKRILPTNDYLPALARENVELVTDGIAEVRPRGIVSKDGRERAADVIVLATGFEAAEHAAPFEVRGRGGRELNEVWRSGPEAYLGTAVAGFPNLFLLVGPNTGLGHSSMVFMIESQITYVLSALQTMSAERLRSVDVRPEVQARYNARLQRRLEGTVWASGCLSWYLTRTGKNTTLWPGFTFEFRLRTRRFDANAYERVAWGGTHSESVAQAPAMTTSSRSFTLT